MNPLPIIAKLNQPKGNLTLSTRYMRVAAYTLISLLNPQP
jgi:hypothetical protein